MAIEQSAPPPEMRASDAERHQLTARLKQACVEGRLTLDEFGERTALAVRARTRSELEALTRDLPEGAAPAAGLTTTSTATLSRPAVSRTLAILSSADRTGAWRIGEQCRAIAVMGSCKLDLRRAAISAAVTTIDVRVVMGSVNVIVPEGVEVDLDATTIMGSRTVKLKGPPPAPGAPVIVIRGLVVMGDVTVRDRPGFWGNRLTA